MKKVSLPQKIWMSMLMKRKRWSKMFGSSNVTPVREVKYMMRTYICNFLVESLTFSMQTIQSSLEMGVVQLVSYEASLSFFAGDKKKTMYTNHKIIISSLFFQF
ncbi:unnamed protein product [Brassica rapa subsp. narinosa]